MKKIGILSSSRADFGIYLPLLNKLQIDNRFDFELIIFGTHLSKFHGYTKKEIIECGFKIHHEIFTSLSGDSEFHISNNIGYTIVEFSKFWNHYNGYFDLVLCLGDRFEMFSAVIASIPFGIKLAHIHGGEQTLGSIDNIFRHAISHSSFIHFTSTEQYAKRVETLIDNTNSVIVNVGALSLDSIFDFIPLSNEEFKVKWKIDLSKPTILTTLHPETVGVNKNRKHVNVLCDLILEYSNREYQFLVSMPNSDTSSNIIREVYSQRLSACKSVFFVENLGKADYFTAMSKCLFMLGNSSSGLIEAASFNKYVINVGERQNGRVHSDNVINCDFDFDKLCNAVDSIRYKSWFGTNPYYNCGAADLIIKTLNDLI
jgi:GDP/UDP-N,N'-diacetylbacillosamine 2-epimerase (hydrolysing)